MNVIEKVFGTHSERELKMIRPIVAKIEFDSITLAEWPWTIVK